jgi:hypothetical protein
MGTPSVGWVGRVCALVFAVLVTAPLLAAAQAHRLGFTGVASITYLGRDWLFIDAGSAEGLRQGSEAEIVRRGRPVALLRVESLGDHQANCSVVSRQLPLMVGDSVRFNPVTPPVQPPPVAARPAAAPQPAPALAPAPAPPPAPPPAAPPARPAAAPVAANTPRSAGALQPSLAPSAPTRRDSTPTRPLAALASAPVQMAPPGTASVTFISGAEIYVSAGRHEGLVEGAELTVTRHDSAVATLQVKFVSSHQSSCELIRGAKNVVVGDAVRFVPRPQAAGAAATLATAAPHHPRRLSGPGIHGRLGLRYLRATSSATMDSSGVPTGSTAFNQPSFDLRMSGLSLGGTALGLSVDLRTRRTVTSSTGQPDRTDGKTRVYQAAVFWGAPGAGFRTVAGRQYLAAVTSIGMIDGQLVELNGPHVSVGVFGGLEPDAATLGFSPDIEDHGGYIQLHNRPGTWSFTTGAVGSYEAGNANREFGFLQASVNNRYVSFYGLQEVDYYRPWKVQLGEKEFSFTSQYATGLLRPSPWLSFSASYDKRRSVRLYRDTQNPETAFDDAYRQGYGGGIQLNGRRIHVGGDWRRSTGGTAGRADSFTGTLSLDRLTPLNLGFVARATWYQNQNDSTLNLPGAPRTRGLLYSAQLGFDPLTALHIDGNWGIRREDNPSTLALQQSIWYGVNVDMSLARAWFVSFSGLRQTDPANPGTNTTVQLYASITWRF